MSRIARSILSLLAVLTVVPLLAAKFWESKDYTSWTEQECRELLTKSPWAFSNGFGQTSDIGSIVQQPEQPEIPEGGMTARRGSPPVTFGEREFGCFFEFRLVSAKPVRMALGQLQALQRPNNPNVQEQVKQYVNAGPGNQILVQISYRTNPPSDSSLFDINSFFTHATLADFHGTTYLISSDRKDNIPISAYFNPGEKRSNPVFVFPRVDENGNPYFTGKEKSIALRSELNITVKGKAQKYHIFFKMSPKQMRFQNEFAL
jgi:hypothetical protein